VPRVSEASLLRAIYVALALPTGTTRDEISSAARRRFGRPHTLRLLSYLADASLEPPTPSVEAGLDLPIPEEWQRAAERISAMSPRDALDHLWDGRAHRKLSAENGSFRITVRTALAGAALQPLESAGVRQPCP
jgi:hypothetical protein